MPASAKRSAPEGTPDRESQARAKMQLAEMAPQALRAGDPVTRVEMSVGDKGKEINHGLTNIAGMFSKKLEDTGRHLKVE